MPFSEDDPIFCAISPYAASKLACEALGHVYHHIYRLDIAMLRFFTVYGPRQRSDLAIHKFARLLRAGNPSQCTATNPTARDYTYIDDILQGVLACTKREFGFEVFNLGESRTVTLAQLIDLIQQAVGIRASIERHPSQPGDVPITYASVDKAKRLLGYQPATPIENGLEKFAAWFRTTA